MIATKDNDQCKKVPNDYEHYFQCKKVSSAYMLEQ